ncbi:MAG TPA: transaldolase, partial [Campylobacterales bacterium]|nr:transaldolase [Campylobacterales bacterium]
YIKGLMAAHSVNTAPLNTIEEYIKAPETKKALPIDTDEINGYFMNLEDNGFKMDDIYKELLDQGLKAFEASFKEMLEKIK